MKVTIEKHRNRLRLRWLYEGKRYSLSPSVDANAMGYAIANQFKGCLSHVLRELPQLAHTISDRTGQEFAKKPSDNIPSYL